jgi:hypothetical protein
LHESGEGREVIVEDSSEQVKTQAKPPSPISVSASEDPEPFQTANAVFDANPNRGEGLIAVLLLNRQRESRWLTLRQDGTGMMSGQSLVPTIGQTPELRCKASPAASPQGQVVSSTRSGRHS